MFKRNYFTPLPSRKALKAHLEFMNSVKDDNPIKQCDNCIHAKSWSGNDWCDFHILAPVGICLEKNKEL